jgi:phage/plasmid primase-like uncharacterized protein
MSKRDDDYRRRVKGIKSGNVHVIDRTKPFDGKCELCGKKDDLRPYGSKGEWICFDCGMKDEAMTGKRFGQVVFGDKPDA